jgi:hypothetical protein
MLRQTNYQETINKQNETNNKKMSQFRYNNYYKYSGRYRSRMLQMNRNDSSIDNISSIDENNGVNEKSNNQALLIGKIDIYHKQLGPGRSLVQYNTNNKGSVMIDDDVDSDRYPSWFLLSFNPHHNQSQPSTPLKALTSSSSIKVYSPIQRRQSEIYDSPKIILADYMQQSERSPYNNNIINNLQQNRYIQKEKINFPQYLLKLQQSEELPSVDILSLPDRVIMSSELSINQIITEREKKETSISLEAEEGDVDDDIDNDDNDDHGIDKIDNVS